MSNVWRIDAYFKRIGLDKKVEMGSSNDKRAAYARVADALMSGGIDFVEVYRDSQLVQSITVYDKEQAE